MAYVGSNDTQELRKVLEQSISREEEVYSQSIGKLYENQEESQFAWEAVETKLTGTWGSPITIWSSSCEEKVERAKTKRM